MNALAKIEDLIIDILHLIGIENGLRALKYACFDFHTECSTMPDSFSVFYMRTGHSIN